MISATKSAAIPICLPVLFLLLAACSADADIQTTPDTSTSTTTSEVAVAEDPTTSTATSPTAQPTASVLQAGEQIPGQQLWALFDGMDPEADRINLIFAPWGWSDHDEFVHRVRTGLSWDQRAIVSFDKPDGTYGEMSLADEGAQTHIDARGYVHFGLFALEPYRSNRHKFNVWYTDVEPKTSGYWLNSRILPDPNDPWAMSLEEWSEHTGPDPFDLPDRSIMTLSIDPPQPIAVSGQDQFFGHDQRFGPRPPLASENTSEEEVSKDVHRVHEGQIRPLERPDPSLTFANAEVASSARLIDFVDVMVHELGHALFGFPDEYLYNSGWDGQLESSGWPTCAESEEEALEWWGDLIGTVDPFFEVWEQEMRDSGTTNVTDAEYKKMREDITVDLIEGGCFGAPGSYRATVDSRMNSNFLILGSVLRREAEAILDLWEGSPRD